jgi:biopolymer transport protein ExbD
MSFLPAHDDDEVMTEINMTPLIDVMLVLLIVFILAVPAIHSAVPLTLPRASSAAPQQPAEPVRLDIDAQGRTYWNGKAVDEDALKAQAQQAATLDPQPVVRLSGDCAVAYERVLQTLSTLQGSGLTKVNFIAQKP